MLFNVCCFAQTIFSVKSQEEINLRTNLNHTIEIQIHPPFHLTLNAPLQFQTKLKEVSLTAAQKSLDKIILTRSYELKNAGNINNESLIFYICSNSGCKKQIAKWQIFILPLNASEISPAHTAKN